MDEFLKPITSTTIKRAVQPDIKSSTGNRDVKNVENAIAVLQSSPSTDELSDALSFLSDFSDQSQDAKVFQAANVIVTDIIPTWWDPVNHDQDLKALKDSLLDYLCRTTCLTLLVSKLRALIPGSKTSDSNSQAGLELRTVLDVLSHVIGNDHTAQKLYERSILAPTVPRQDANWKEAVSLLSSGRIIATAAEAEDAIMPQVKKFGPSWLAQGSKYGKWLGRNIGTMLSVSEIRPQDTRYKVAIATLVGKSLMIGYQGK